MGTVGRRVVLGVSLAAAGLVVVHSLTWDMTRWDGDVFVADSTALVAVGAAKAGLFRASLLFDMFGSYLLTLPATLALWRFLRQRHDPALVDLLALGGVIYALAGAAAAVVWAEAGAALIRAYAVTPNAAVASDFAALARSAIGVWQIVCVLTGGAWWLGSGLLLRSRWKWFSRYSIAFGALAIAIGLTKTLGVDLNSSGPATAAFAPIAVWIGWLGVRLATADR